MDQPLCVCVSEDLFLFFFPEQQEAGSAGERTLLGAAIKQGFLATGV